MLFSRHIYWTTLGHILFILATAGTGLWAHYFPTRSGNRDITGYLLLVSDWKISE